MTEESQTANTSIILICDTCGKPVKESSRDDIGTIFYKCENGHKTAAPIQKTYAPMMYGHISSYQDEYGKFQPIALAKDLMDNYFFKTDKKSLTIYVFSMERGIWEPLGEILIEQIVAEKLKLEYKQHFLTDIKGYIRASTYADLHETPDKLALENGILDVVTGEIEQPNPNEFIITRLPVTYDKNAQCPKSIKFLTEVFGKEQLPIVQELIGYCLYKAMPFHKAVLLIGEGRNGKSTFLNLLVAFLGIENTAHVTLQDLCVNRFAVAELLGKLANIRADLTKTTLASVGRFKELTGNDRIMAEFKHENPFTFQATAKQIYSCNEAPEIKEDTLAIFSRWIILACNNIFLGQNCDPKILEKLTAPSELSGLLNYALEGLKRLLDTGTFSINEDIAELRVTMIRKMNSAKAFIEEQISYENDINAFIEESELYSKFILYCKKEKLPTTNKANFTKNMHEYLTQAKQTTRRVAGKIVHVWQFVKLFKSVATVATSLFTPENQLSYSTVNNQPATVATEPSHREVSEKVGSQFVEDTQESLRTCGHCDLWHKGGCCFPGDPSCVAANNPYALDCRSFTAKGENQS
ncbi:phage/plasmid primase, P4 family [Candidatus Bathyarchaeota archaeon]|nr:phage/plasmid primase, P4 family [Candidatus Bathyarchaeota archaeon]